MRKVEHVFLLTNKSCLLCEKIHLTCKIISNISYLILQRNINVLSKPVDPSLPLSITKTNCTEELPPVSKAMDWIIDQLPPIQWPTYNYLGPG